MITASGDEQSGLKLETSALAEFAFDRAPFGISLTSARPATYGRYVLANPAYCAITGYDTAALQARYFCDVVHADDLAALTESLERLSSGVTAAIDAETRLRRCDGSSIWVRQHRSLIRNDVGEPLVFLVHTEDISKHRSAEAAAIAARHAAAEAMRESETRYRLLAEHAADMIVRTRADRTRTYVSPASQTLLGFEPREIIDCDFATFLHPDDRERVTAEYGRFLIRGGRDTHTYRLRHKNGSYVWVEAHWVATGSAPGDLRATPITPLSPSCAISPNARPRKRRSPYWRATIRSAVLQIACSFTNGSVKRSASWKRATRRPPCYGSISTILKESTIRSATRSATRCCESSPNA